MCYKIRELISNPILRLDPWYFREDNLFKLQTIINTIALNEEIPKYKLFEEMIYFENVFKIFKSHDLLLDDPYYGKIKLKKELYFILYKYINIDYLIKPIIVDKKYFKTELNNFDYNNLNWKLIYEDIVILTKAVKLRILDEAMKILCLLKIDAPIICHEIIRNIIVDYEGRKDDSRGIMTDFNQNAFIVDNKYKIYFNNYDEIKVEIKKIYS